MNEGNLSEVTFFSMMLSILLSTFRVSVPLVFTASGGILSERSGVINIALEGLMLIGAFTAASVAFFTHSPWLGALAGMAAGILLASIYALFVIQFRADQIVAGTAINLLAFGVTPLLAKVFFDSTGATPSLELHDRFGNEPLYLALFMVLAVAAWFKYSRLGLWLGFAGEHPEALSTAGIRVRRVRWFGVLASGALAGLGGVTLSIYLSSSFSRGMTAGRGFMALAALIFGKWKPIPTLFACLFFGLTDALQIRLQGVPIFGESPIPVQFIQILPYVFTVLVLAGFMGKSRPPKALGAPWLGVFICVGFFFTQGCDFSPRAPSTTHVENPLPTSELRSPEARLSKENAELLVELNRVVFLKEPRDPERFGAYLASLNQGASLEGILNGLIHSTGYREFEALSPAASSAARSFFITELLKIQGELKTPFYISPATGKPLAKLEIPGGKAGGLKGAESGLFFAQQAAKDYARWFERSSLPILKRVMVEAVLERIQTSGAGLPDWYAATASRLGGAGVNFGLDQRNLRDAAFHKKWFLDLQTRMPAERAHDRLVWESLNRYLRILNHLNKESPK